MNKLAIKFIKSYQKNRPHKTSHCRFHPRCSNYGLESFQKFSFLHASILTIWRIIRCNPLSKVSYDPVPDSRIEKLFKLDYLK